MSIFTQSAPNFYAGFVPTPAQWISYFAAKQDALGYAPVNRAGDTMLGPLNIAPPNTAQASLNIAPGVAPLSPNNGDVWATQSGLFAQIAGVTVLLGGSAMSSTSNASGSFGEDSINSTAVVQVAFHTVVKTVAMGVAPASSDDTANIGAALGIAVNGASAGAAIVVQTNGQITDNSWSWAPGPVFLGLNGALTQTAPTTGVLQTIGVSSSPTSILIEIQDPILRN